MATIDLNNLHPAGADLFLESENYLNELNEVELANIRGEGTPFSVSYVLTYALYLAVVVVAIDKCD